MSDPQFPKQSTLPITSENILNVPQNGNIVLLNTEKIKKTQLEMPDNGFPSIQPISGVFTNPNASTKNPFSTMMEGYIGDNDLNPNIILHQKELDNTFSDGFMKRVIHAAHLYLLLWFLAVYVIVYYVFGFFLNMNDKKDLEKSYTSISGGITMMGQTLNGTFDFVMFLSLILFLVYLYLSSDDNTRSNLIPALWNWSWEWSSDPINFFGLILFTIVFYLLLYVLRIPMKHELHSYFVFFIDGKIWSVLAFFLLIFIFKYLLGIDIPAYFLGDNFITDLWGGGIDIKDKDSIPLKGNAKPTSGNTIVKGNTISTASSTKKPDEVFNIANNLYTYEDAQSVCSVYGARLANYNDMEDAYNKGGEWCNYGWSDGQMAFFPTQKSTWDKIQANPVTKNTCGRPGVNGGFIPNPYLRLGVNCVGQRPLPKNVDIENMKKSVIPPKNPEQVIVNKKVEFWKENQDKLLQINSFNKTNWSEF